MRQLLHKVSRAKLRIGPLWWNTGLMFCMSRVADLVQLYIGMFLVPAVLSQDDLGAVLPLTRLAVLVTVPLSVVSGTVLKYVNLFLVREEHGRIQALLRDLVWLLSIVVLLLVCALWLGWDAIARRLGISDPRLVWVMAGMIVLSCWVPVVTTVSQGLKHFYRLTFSRLAGPIARLVVTLLCLRSLQLVGYFAALLASNAATILTLSGGAISYLRRRVTAHSYRDLLPEMVRYGLPFGATTFLIALQRAVEPWVIRHRLPAVDSAGYYVAAMFGNVPLFVAPAMIPFLFPLVAERFERGEPTHRLHAQSVAAVVTIGLAVAGFLALFGRYILVLRPAWAQYAAYAPYMWQIALITTVDVLVSCHVTHETACRQFGYLKYLAPVVLLGVATLYTLPHYFPATRTLSFLIHYMLALRACLVVVSLLTFLKNRLRKA